MKKVSLLTILSLSLFLVSCGKDEVAAVPSSVTNTGQTTQEITPVTPIAQKTIEEIVVDIENRVYVEGLKSGDNAVYFETERKKINFFGLPVYEWVETYTQLTVNYIFSESIMFSVIESNNDYENVSYNKNKTLEHFEGLHSNNSNVSVIDYNIGNRAVKAYEIRSISEEGLEMKIIYSPEVPVALNPIEIQNVTEQKLYRLIEFNQ